MTSLVLALLLATEPAEPPAELNWAPKVEVPVAIGLGLGWLVTEFAIKRQLSPPACRWCQPNDFDTGVRRVFNPSLAPSASGVGVPDALSNIVSLAALPIAMIGLDALFEHDPSNAWLVRWGADLTMIFEATFAAMAVTQVVKFTVARARPYSVGLTTLAAEPLDQNLSFFSGHTTFAFALATSAGVIATLRGFRYAWVTWAVGMPLAVATAVLRMAADKHWASDVLVGIGVASVFSVGLPLLFHQRLPVTVSASPGGVSVSGTF